MTFKDWFILHEDWMENKLFRRALNPINLGTIGLWTVEFNPFQGNVGLYGGGPLAYYIYWDAYDGAKDNFVALKKYIKECADKITFAGIPAIHSYLMVDGNKMSGSISGTPGTAHRSEHGIILSAFIHGSDTLIHEHAHMVWFGLPLKNRNYFIAATERLSPVSNYAQKNNEERWAEVFAYVVLNKTSEPRLKHIVINTIFGTLQKDTIYDRLQRQKLQKDPFVSKLVGPLRNLLDI